MSAPKQSSTLQAPCRIGPAKTKPAPEGAGENVFRKRGL
jgi:hypothetical protein